jgi:hypothetical protein
MEAFLVFVSFLYALKVRSHVDTDGWTSREKEIGHIDFPLEEGRIGFIAPLIDKVKITNAVATSYTLEVIVHHSRVQI